MSVIDDGEKRALDAYRAFLDDFPEKEPVVVDVGANRGDYTAEVLERFPRARIYCFEPQPSAFRLLEERFSLNSNVGLHTQGLSIEEGVAELRSTANEACVLATLTARQEDVCDSSVKLPVIERVSLARLDETCWDLGIGKIDWLKIDTEGHDYDVLLGAGVMLGHVAVVQFEFNPTTTAEGWSFLDFWNLLAEDRDLWRLDTDGSATRIVVYDEAQEGGLPQRNYLAVKRGMDFTP